MTSEKKFGANFVIGEDTIALCVDTGLRTRRDWRFARFVSRPDTYEMVHKGFSRESELIRNTELLILAAVGLSHMGLNRQEIYNVLKQLLETSDIRVPDNFAKNEKTKN